MKGNKKVFLGMSGGVDSSVSALLLKKAGYDVTGVFIKGWYPDFLVCDWKEDRRDAMRVAVSLDIPFLTIDAESAYKKEVVDYMIREYAKGLTPNPDVMCNRHVKFGVFYNEARNLGADYIATGHYARIEKEDSSVKLKMGKDKNKDQSYFLWNVDEVSLKNTLFPVGGYLKKEIRKIAQDYKLITAQKKDSQGVCFLGKVSMKEFISHFVDTEVGKVLNPVGEVVGHHPGVALFTIGERRGFTITKKGAEDSPRFVIRKDIQNNTITVSGKEEKSYIEHKIDRIKIRDTNWISGEPKDGENIEVRYRHRGPLNRVKIKKNECNDMEVVFEEPQVALSSGQSLVFYRGEECLGGGIII